MSSFRLCISAMLRIFATPGNLSPSTRRSTANSENFIELIVLGDAGASWEAAAVASGTLALPLGLRAPGDAGAACLAAAVALGALALGSSALASRASALASEAAAVASGALASGSSALASGASALASEAGGDEAPPPSAVAAAVVCAAAATAEAACLLRELGSHRCDSTAAVADRAAVAAEISLV